MERKTRIEYIDIAKGILMLCLIYGHMTLFASILGMDDPVRANIHSNIRLYGTFFMQTFFIITGFCSTFRIKFSSFIWKNIKILIFPAFILCIGCGCFNVILSGETFSAKNVINFNEWLVSKSGPWFIFALFEAKILYWFISKLKIRWQITILLIGYMLGLFLSSKGITNYLFCHHTLLMLPYLAIGNIAKNHQQIISDNLKKYAVWGGLILGIQFLFDFPVPAQDFNIGVSFKTFPLHFLNVISGTCLVIYLARFIGHSRILSMFGRGSLLVYLANGLVSNVVLYLCMPIYENLPQSLLFAFYFLVYVLMVLFSYILVRLIYGYKRLSWIVGKW